MTQLEFARQLEIQRKELISLVEKSFYYLEAGDLNAKIRPDSWSILQCFDHINKVNGLYLKAFERRIDSYSDGSHSEDTYQVGPMGNFMISAMSPKEGIIRWKMKTFARLRPLNEQHPEAKLSEQVVFEDFQGDMERLRLVIEKSHALPWKSTLIKSALGSVVKFRMGDALAFVLGHTHRHIQQALNVKNLIVE